MSTLKCSKAIRHMDTGRVELYDLSADPDERNDLAAIGQAAPAELLDAMGREIKRFVKIEWDPLRDSRVRERLRGLGYL